MAALPLQATRWGDVTVDVWLDQPANIFSFSVLCRRHLLQVLCVVSLAAQFSLVLCFEPTEHSLMACWMVQVNLYLPISESSGNPQTSIVAPSHNPNPCQPFGDCTTAVKTRAKVEWLPII